MGACLSAPKPAADGPSVSARSARTFGVAPVQTAKSDVESSGEMVEIPLDTPPAAASGAGKGNGFGSFLQAKVTVDPGSAEDANGAAHRVLGALVPERDRIDQALVDDMDAAVASALAGSDEKDAESGSSADHVASAEAEAAAAREQDVSLVLSDDASDEETFSGSEEDPEDDDDDSDEYDSSDASSAEVDEGEDAHPSAGSTEDAIEHATDDATDDVPAPATPQTNEPAANASDDAPIPVPGTPEQTRALTALEDDFEDSLSMVDMGPVSDSEASGSEFDSAASESYESDGDEDAENAAETATSTEPSADVSASAPEAPRAPEAAADDSPDATVSDILDDDALGDRETDPSADDSESSYASSAYSDEDDRFDADAGPLVASTVEAFGSTVDATVTEVRARSKHSPPPTPRVRGAADPEALGAFGSGSLGATPRSARSGGALLSSRSGGSGGPDSHRRGPDPERRTASEGWTSVVVLYVTSVSAVRVTAGRCQRVRQTLANLGVEFLERDISMATAYKDELARRVAATAAAKGEGDAITSAAAFSGEESEKEPKKPSSGKPPTSVGSSSGSSPSELVVPCLFVDDAFVGSGEALDLSAHDGSLNALLEERGRLGRARAEKDACLSCAGRRLVICDRCDGSMRWLLEDKKTGAVLGERRCPWCNEVGMQECRTCVPAFARTTGGRRGGR
jgi:hypothetical protein